MGRRRVRTWVAVAAGLAVVLSTLGGVPDTPADLAAPATAAAPPPPPPIIDRNQFVGPGGVVRNDLVAAADQFEASAVNAVLAQFRLPASDASAVMGWARDQVRAQLWADMAAIIQNGPDPSRPYEALMLEWFRGVVQQENVAAAQAAVDEYLAYSGHDISTYAKPGSDPVPRSADGTGYCTYRMPADFVAAYPHLEYVGWRDPLLCQSSLPPNPVLFLAPKVPSDDEDGGFSTFVKIGQWRAQQRRLSSDQYQAASALQWGVASAITQGAVLAGVGIGIGIVTKLTKAGLAPGPIIKAIFPYAFRAKKVLTIAGEFATKGAAKLAAKGAAKVGAKVAAKMVPKLMGRLLMASVGVIIDFVITTVLTSIDLAQQLELPVRLAKLLEKARATKPDLKPLAANAATYPGLMTSFLMTTTPEAEEGCVDDELIIRGDAVFPIGCTNAPTPPAPGATDPIFKVVPPAGPSASWMTEAVTILSPLGDRLYVRITPQGWFVYNKLDPETGEAGPPIQSLDLPFMDWDGNAWMAQRVWTAAQGHHFVLAPVDAQFTAANTCVDVSCLTVGLRALDDRGNRVTLIAVDRPAQTDVVAPKVDHPATIVRGLATQFRVTNPEPGITYSWRFPCNGGEPDCLGTWYEAEGYFGEPYRKSVLGTVVTTPVTNWGSAEVVAVRNGVDVKATPLTYNLVQATNAIEFDQPVDMAYSRDPITGIPGNWQTLNVLAESLRPVTLTVAPQSADVCLVSGVEVLATGVGTCTITATQNGDQVQYDPVKDLWYWLPYGVYPHATPVTRSFQVTKGDAYVTVRRGPVQYSDPFPADAQVQIPSPFFDITGSLTGCGAADWLADGSGSVLMPRGEYRLANCGGFSSPLFNVGYDAVVRVLPEDATLEDLTRTSPNAAELRVRLNPSADGTPGDVLNARLDIGLFAPGNTGDVPDYPVTGVAVGPDRLAVVPMSDLAAGTYRLVATVSDTQGFYAAPPMTATVVVPGPAQPAPAPEPAPAPAPEAPQEPAAPQDPATPQEPVVVDPAEDGSAAVVVAPGKVTGVRVLVAKDRTSARLRWSAPGDDVTGYRIRVSRPDSTKYDAWRSVDGTSTVLKKLRPKARYRVQVVAVNEAGTGPSATVVFRTVRA